MYLCSLSYKIFSNFFNIKDKMLTVLKFGSLLWFNFSKTGIMSESFNISRSFFINWAKNWKVLIWFKRKTKNFRDFRVFDFALYPRSKARKSRKFRLPRIMTLIVIQDLKRPKKSFETKTKRFQYDLEQKEKFPRFPSFGFCSIPKIKNSEILESSILIQILTV